MLKTVLKRSLLGLLIGLPILLLVAWAGLYFASERVLYRSHELPELAGSNPVGEALMDGERLARITGCYGCHGADLNGSVFFDQPRIARLVAPDLTRLVRLYSDDELEQVIRYGIRPDGSSVWAMPSSMYYHLHDADLAELIAHLRSLPEGNGPIREFRLGILGRIALASGQFKPMAEEIPDVPRISPAREHPLDLGRYLARIACTECHGQDLRGAGEAPDLRMAIAFEEDAFRRLMHEGIGLGGGELGLMKAVSNSRFVHFTDEEIQALHAYLKALIDEDAVDTYTPAPEVGHASDPSAAPRFTHEQFAAVVEPIAEQAIREQGLSGLSIGIGYCGEPAYVTGFGTADLDNQRPATGDTQYDTGSIAKTFIAVALLQLAEQGRINLDDPVSRHIPGYEGPMADARIRELLNHTSGYRGGPDIDEEVRQPELERPQTMAELLAMPIVTEARREFAPGESFQYSNSAYHLLRVVLDSVTGHEFGETISRQIFTPAGMTNSLAGERAKGPDGARLYMRREDALLPLPPIHPHVFPSIITSVRELLAFQCALNAGSLLSPDSLELMNTPARIAAEPDGLLAPFGLGVMLSPPGWRQKRGHQGTFPGGTAHLSYYPDDGLTIAVLTNTNGPGVVQARQIEPRIAHALFGDQAAGLSATPLPVDEDFARLVTGRFLFRGFVDDITWEDGELRVRDPETGTLWGRLFRVGPRETVFVADGDDLTDYHLSNPPSEISIVSSSGNHVLWFREGGMFWDVGVRVSATD